MSDFRDIAAKRKRYNPATEGYGNVKQWRGTFYQRMGWDEAQEILRGSKQSPRQILGVGMNATWAEIKSAFRKLSLEWHPDRIHVTGKSLEASTEGFKRISAAYTALEREF